jgi:hypothetical protein
MFVALWQFAPLLVDLIHWVISAMDEFSHPPSSATPIHPITASGKADQTTLEGRSKVDKIKFKGASEPKDLKYLRQIYIASFLISLLVHWTTLAVSFLNSSTSPSLTLRHIFWPNQSRAHQGRITEQLMFIFQIDWWIIFAATLIWCVQSMGKLRGLGGKSDSGIVMTCIFVCLGSVVLGPGAVLSVVWLIREERWAKLEREGKTERQRKEQ